MKYIFPIIFFLFSISLFSQDKYSTFYHQRASLFSELPIGKKDIVFVGNSITNGGEWSELFNNKHVKNRGISGDISQGVYDRLEPIVSGKPKKIFILIGVNDLAKGTSPDSVNINIAKIVDKILLQSPRTKVYLQSILPVNADFNLFSGHTSKVEEIKEANKGMENLARAKSITYIDLYSLFVLPNTDKLNAKYTNDGLHLIGAGYLHWRNALLHYLK